MNPSQRSILLITVIAIILVALLAGLNQFNYRYLQQNPDEGVFLPRWLGTRLYFTQGWNPYSALTSLEIQTAFYGRSANVDEDPKLFLYPVYTMLFYAPVAFIEDLTLAQAWWMTALEAALLLIAAFSISAVGWRPPVWLMGAYLLFAMSWHYNVRPVLTGDLSVVSALFITLTLYLLHTKKDAPAGFMLALATVKPQMVYLLIPLALGWTFFQRRWGFIRGFLGSLAALVLLGMLVAPDWVQLNVWQVMYYVKNTVLSASGTMLEALLPRGGENLGWALTGILGLVLVWEWVVAWGKDFRWFLWTACLTLAISSLISIPTATVNQIALLPVITLVFAMWDTRWDRGGRWLIVLLMALLSTGAWTVYNRVLESAQGALPVDIPILFFFLPMFLLFNLYWVRWWAVRPRRTLLEDLRTYERL